jgi:hypothetical protein
MAEVPRFGRVTQAADPQITAQRPEEVEEPSH